mmetsp:Transcript_21525/g.67262  ORF Transcript_21525/g.67262 Transcript_21525/m.67262 type:complete len:254 (+) Transcript_21525:657-1418(+)
MSMCCNGGHALGASHCSPVRSVVAAAPAPMRRPLSRRARTMAFSSGEAGATRAAQSGAANEERAVTVDGAASRKCQSRQSPTSGRQSQRRMAAALRSAAASRSRARASCAATSAYPRVGPSAACLAAAAAWSRARVLSALKRRALRSTGTTLLVSMRARPPPASASAAWPASPGHTEGALRSHLDEKSQPDSAAALRSARARPGWAALADVAVSSRKASGRGDSSADENRERCARLGARPTSSPTTAPRALRS